MIMAMTPFMTYLSIQSRMSASFPQNTKIDWTLTESLRHGVMLPLLASLPSGSRSQSEEKAPQPQVELLV